jgi:hypothetical protein
MDHSISGKGLQHVQNTEKLDRKVKQGRGQSTIRHFRTDNQTLITLELALTSSIYEEVKGVKGVKGVMRVMRVMKVEKQRVADFLINIESESDCVEHCVRHCVDILRIRKMSISATLRRVSSISSQNSITHRLWLPRVESMLLGSPRLGRSIIVGRCH